MNTDLNLATTALRRGELLRVVDAKGVLLQCLSGTLWLTQHADPRDVVLEAGDEARIERDGLSIVNALSDARFVLLHEPAPKAVAARGGSATRLGLCS
jgi:hypothetical protein